MAELGMAYLQPIAAQQGMDRAEAMAPLELAHKASVARLNNAQAGNMEADQEGEKKAATLMAQRLGQGLGGMPISDFLGEQARIYAESGLPMKATEALKAAGVVANQEAMRETQEQAQATAALRLRAQLGKQFGGMLGEVKDQAGWEEVGRVWEQTTGQKNPLAELPYSPRTVEMLKAQALSLKDKAELAIREAEAAARKRNIDSQISRRALQNVVSDARLDLARKREDRLAKEGGKDVGSPTGTETKAARNILAGQPDLVAEGDLDVAAFDVAAQAKALRHANRGLTMDDAIRQVITTKREKGEFAEGEPGTKVLGMTFGKGAPKYTAAEPLPKSGKVADLVAGKLYKNKAGQTMVWDGKGWKQPKPAAAPKAPPPEDDDEDLPGEDDDE